MYIQKQTCQTKTTVFVLEMNTLCWALLLTLHTFDKKLSHYQLTSCGDVLLFLSMSIINLGITK